jgi:uncharacterized repeat protein (TIGR04138 family)
MNGIVLDDAVLDRLRERNPRFQEMAYVFILSALHYVLQHLDETRHISGKELTEGVRDLAREKFGPMARTGLEDWSRHEKGEVCDIVFALVEAGILIKQPEDTRADFEDVYDFAEAFQTNYPRTGQTSE